VQTICWPKSIAAFASSHAVLALFFLFFENRERFKEEGMNYRLYVLMGRHIYKLDWTNSEARQHGGSLGKLTSVKCE
jgi:hypothetical protein